MEAERCCRRGGPEGKKTLDDRVSQHLEPGLPVAARRKRKLKFPHT